MPRRGLYGLFFLSGISALIYEVVWQRLLNLVFGLSTLSVSAVLAAFLTGLALGSFAFGRFADRTTRPLRCYAWLEAGIGAVGLLVPPGFAALTTVYTWLYSFLQPGPWHGAYLRFAMALLVLMVPATLMGGTFPMMGRLAVRRTHPSPTAFGLLYAINTLGAVTGAALTGFVLLHLLGMQQTLWMAALLNFSIALCAARASRIEAFGGSDRSTTIQEGAREDAVPSGSLLNDARPGADSDPPRRHWVAMGCAGMTGAASLALEVTWTRVLGILTSNSAYGFALVLTVLLLGLGLGSLLQSWWSRHPGNSWRRLAVCQWLLAGITLLSISFSHSSPGWLERWCDGHSVAAIFVAELALTSSVLLLPGVLMGSCLPFLVAAAANDRYSFGRQLGQLYAANTLSGVGGALLAGFVLIPWLGIHATFGIIIVWTALIGVFAWIRTGAQASKGRSLARRFAALTPVLVILSGALGWMCLPPGRYLKSPVLEPRRLLFYREGNNATVSVVEEEHGARTLLVDGQPVAGTAHTSVVDQKMLAHLPLLLHPGPTHALTVGFGSGGTSYSMTLHGVQVDCVEIEGAVPAAANYFAGENHDILAHPRFRLIVDDARSWLRVAPMLYDVIVTDCTNIQYRSNGDLYTVDYFRLLKDRLTENGLAAAWVPANGIADQDLKTLLRTFRQVFPHTSVWYMNVRPTDFLIVVGTPGTLEIDLDSLHRRMLVPDIARDLSEVGLADPCRLLYTFVAADDELAPYLGKGVLNTDDRPILSYSTYGATFRATIAANLLRLLACRADVAHYVRHAAPTETMMRYYAASNQSILGHIAHLSGTETVALAQYRNGVQLLPDDPALQELVSASYQTLNLPSRKR